MHVTKTHAGAPVGSIHAAGIAGDAYVASLMVRIEGDGTTQACEMDGRTFDQMLGALQMRQLAFETRTRIFRPYATKGLFMVQRIDRCQPALDAAAAENPQIHRLAETLRSICELSDTIRWSLA